MWRALAVAIALFLTGAPAIAEAPAPLSVVRNGGAAGGDALYIPRGDILNVRNIQGGVIGDLNLDLGAGSTQDPGNVVVNYDVGRCTYIYDGQKHPLASFCPGRIRFYVPVQVPRSQWSWRPVMPRHPH